MMTPEYFHEAISTLRKFPNMVGMMGGEPLLHPQFEDLCYIAMAKVPRARMGLWSSFPPGKEHYREIIVKTFGNIFINDHTRDIYHAPILVGAEEVISDEQEMWWLIDKCWLQNSWSASINPKGAFFCEIAASMSVLFDNEESHAWELTDNWWKRVPFQYWEQVNKWCRRCGCALSIGRRLSKEGIDDISPKNLERLDGNSRRVSKGEYLIHDCKQIKEPQEMFQYKDLAYRDRIAARYGIFQTLNAKQFLEPHLLPEFRQGCERPSYFQRILDRYGK